MLSVNACTQDEPVKIRRSESALIASPAAFTFPLYEGEPLIRSVELLNDGPDSIQLFEIQGTFAQNNFDWTYEVGLGGPMNFPEGLEMGSDNLPRIILLAGESVKFTLTFSPQADNALPDGTITFRTNAGAVTPDELEVAPTEVVIPITGVRPMPELRIAPTAVSFREAEQGEFTIKPVTLTNTGELGVEFNAYRLTGSNDFGFFIDEVPSQVALDTIQIGDDDPRCNYTAVPGNRDPRLNETLLIDPDEDDVRGLAPGRSVTLCVSFQGSVLTAQDARIEIDANTEPAVNVIEMSANAEGPCLQVLPSPLNLSGNVGARNESLLTLESCGELPVRIDEIESISGGEVFEIVEARLPAQPPFALPGIENPANPVRPSRGVPVAFTPPDESQYTGVLRVLSNDTFMPEKLIELNGRAIDNECPVAAIDEADRTLRVRPLDVVNLDGELSSDPDGPNGQPVKYRWTVISRPAGSTSQPVESFSNQFRPQDGGPADAESTPFAFFWVDLIGTYEIELTVVDDYGTEAPSSTCQQDPIIVRIEAEPDEDLSVELVWNTPSDFDQTDGDGTDLDLHVAHPTSPAWFDRRLDCHYRNPIADWGNSEANNATLDVDDTDGAGPEKISILEPENTSELGGPYKVAAHYYSDAGFGVGIGGSFGPSDATVRITIRGQMAEEFTQTMNNWDLWEVGGIEWTDEDRRIIESNAPVYEERPPGL